MLNPCRGHDHWKWAPLLLALFGIAGRPVQVRQLVGKTVQVDLFFWISCDSLHRQAFGSPHYEVTPFSFGNCKDALHLTVVIVFFFSSNYPELSREHEPPLFGAVVAS